MITSRQHPLIKQLIKLEESAHYRKKTQLTILDGLHLIQAYHATKGLPEHLIVSASYHERSDPPKNWHTLFGETLPTMTVVSDSLMRAVSPVKTPTGILALIVNPVAEKNRDRGSEHHIVLLEAIQDPGNLGSILRSAAAANVDSVYLSQDCCDAWSPKTLRAGMGAHFSLDIFENSDLIEVSEHFPGKVIATALHATENLFEISLHGPTAWVFGNEGNGLSLEILQQSDSIIKIPMPGETESLNVAACAAICLFEKVRQNYPAQTDKIGTKP
ncbi:MAG TPA: RNA methyltransferase [Nitrosomonas sp.]|nr:RNA methyltransferase [Nitrosomonas sp.]HQX13265.1 RNA methyltransferase [Nitrosomonas sp.]HRB32013.1 RNA methyltransferase [Nitrosomonas sp.]HRB45538.1 RNA methyltransferase [Nitrosomonas sp.]HRB76947.1 RNA methyltransferase [Nitrosomonas sp.]